MVYLQIVVDRRQHKVLMEERFIIIVEGDKGEYKSLIT